jgi:3-dehydroquinate dehydratase-2
VLRADGHDLEYADCEAAPPVVLDLPQPAKITSARAFIQSIAAETLDVLIGKDRSMSAFPSLVPLRTSTRAHSIAVIDGPNMSNLGARNKLIYGEFATLADLQNFCKSFGETCGVEVTSFNSNFEGEILEFIHKSAHSVDAYIINPAGMTEGGVATKHALVETGKPYIEVHFANIAAPPSAPRGLPIGPWQSTFTPYATGVIMGVRQYSYIAAILAAVLSLDDATFLGAALDTGKVSPVATQ